jgi:hypothetical protein
MELHSCLTDEHACILLLGDNGKHEWCTYRVGPRLPDSCTSSGKAACEWGQRKLTIHENSSEPSQQASERRVSVDVTEKGFDGPDNVTVS